MYEQFKNIDGIDISKEKMEAIQLTVECLKHSATAHTLEKGSTPALMSENAFMDEMRSLLM